MDISDVTACSFLDSHGRYAKRADQISLVRLFTGEACDHRDITAAEYSVLTNEQRTTLTNLPGRPACIDTAGKSNF